jgi:hypothetical protein
MVHQAQRHVPVAAVVCLATWRRTRPATADGRPASACLTPSFAGSTSREVDEDEPGGRRGPGELVASMLDDPDGLFGSVAHHLPLEEAIERGIVAPYQVLMPTPVAPASRAPEALPALKLGDATAALLSKGRSDHAGAGGSVASSSAYWPVTR